MYEEKLVDEIWLRQQIKESIEKEIVLLEDNIVGDAIRVAAGDVFGGTLTKVGRFMDDSFIGRTLGGSIRSLILRRLADYFTFNIDSGAGLLVRIILENMKFEHMAQIVSGTIECDDVLEIATRTLSDWILQLGVREIVAYLLVNYDVTEFMNNVIDFDLGFAGAENIVALQVFGNQDTLSELSRNQANQVVNSLVGIVGMQVLEQFVFYLVETYILPTLTEKICDSFTSGEIDVKEIAADAKRKGTVGKGAKLIDDFVDSVGGAGGSSGPNLDFIGGL